MGECKLSIFVFKVEPIANAYTGWVVRIYVGKTKNEVDVLVDSSVEFGQAVSYLGNFVEFHIQNSAFGWLNTDVINEFDVMLE